MALEGWQQGVIQEKDELESRMQKLKAFMETKTFMDFEFPEKDILHRQLKAQIVYHDYLQRRIAAFPQDGATAATPPEAPTAAIEAKPGD